MKKNKKQPIMNCFPSVKINTVLKLSFQIQCISVSFRYCRFNTVLKPQMIVRMCFSIQ